MGRLDGKIALITDGSGLFLAADESSYCSGHEFVVDGVMQA